MRTIHEIRQLELLALTGMLDLIQFMIQYKVRIPVINITDIRTFIYDLLILFQKFHLLVYLLVSSYSIIF